MVTFETQGDSSQHVCLTGTKSQDAEMKLLEALVFLLPRC